MSKMVKRRELSKNKLAARSSARSQNSKALKMAREKDEAFDRKVLAFTTAKMPQFDPKNAEEFFKELIGFRPIQRLNAPARRTRQAGIVWLYAVIVGNRDHLKSEVFKRAVSSHGLMVGRKSKDPLFLLVRLAFDYEPASHLASAGEPLRAPGTVLKAASDDVAALRHLLDRGIDPVEARKLIGPGKGETLTEWVRAGRALNKGKKAKGSRRKQAPEPPTASKPESSRKSENATSKKAVKERAKPETDIEYSVSSESILLTDIPCMGDIYMTRGKLAYIQVNEHDEIELMKVFGAASRYCREKGYERLRKDCERSIPGIFG